MLGVCIGLGPEEWGRAAEWSAARMQMLTGVQCIAVKTPPEERAVHPSWYKCQVSLRLHQATAGVPDDETIFIFDADLIPLRPWNPHLVFDGRFAAVAEPPNNPWIDQECRKWKVYREYFNTGFIASNGSHRSLWQRTWAFHPDGGSWAEQTAMNLAAQEANTPVNILPLSFNTLRRPFHEDLSVPALLDTGATNVHFAGLKGRVDIVRNVQMEIDRLRIGVI